MTIENLEVILAHLETMLKQVKSDVDRRKECDKFNRTPMGSALDLSFKVEADVSKCIVRVSSYIYPGALVSLDCDLCWSENYVGPRSRSVVETEISNRYHKAMTCSIEEGVESLEFDSFVLKFDKRRNNEMGWVPECSKSYMTGCLDSISRVLGERSSRYHTHLGIQNQEAVPV